MSGGERGRGDEKEVARQRGARGETFAYGHLRRHGYALVAPTYVAKGVPDEISLVG